MNRMLLTTTALVALLSGGAFAQEATTNANQAGSSNLLTEGYQIVDTDGLASRLLGFPVYTSAAADAERIGEVNDLVINESGDVAAVIIGVGGFLGIGEKNVAVDYSDLQWATADDNTERLVLETTKEALNAAPAVELREDQPTDTAATQTQPADQPAEDQPAQTAASQQPADQPAEDQPAQTAANEQPAADPDARLETGAIGDQPAEDQAGGAATTAMDPLDRSKLTQFDEATLTAEELTGVNVYGPADEHIGVIGDFVLGEDGKLIDAVIIDFGGFLGIGTKEVAVAYENLDFYQDENGNNRYLILNITREQMEQAPAFDKDTYAAERDSQRVVVGAAAAQAG